MEIYFFLMNGQFKIMKKTIIIGAGSVAIKSKKQSRTYFGSPLKKIF